MLSALDNNQNDKTQYSVEGVHHFDLGFCVMKLLDSGILINDYARECRVDLHHIHEMNEVMKMIHEKSGKMHPICSIIPRDLTITKEAREYGSTKEANPYTAATAIVLSSLAHRILGNFIMRVQRPHMPFRLFANSDEALKWLAQYL